MIRNNYLTLFFCFTINFCNAQIADINYTAYNCIHPSYDTTLTVSSGDTLHFISTVFGTVNLFYSVNNQLLDTVAVSTGNLIKQHVISASDTVIEIVVWTTPGSCYGQRFHLSQPAGINDTTDLPKLIWTRETNLLQIHNTTFIELTLIDLSGKMVKNISLEKNTLNSVQLYPELKGVLIALLKDEREIVKFKLQL